MKNAIDLTILEPKVTAMVKSIGSGDNKVLWTDRLAIGTKGWISAHAEKPSK